MVGNSYIQELLFRKGFEERLFFDLAKSPTGQILLGKSTNLLVKWLTIKQILHTHWFQQKWTNPYSLHLNQQGSLWMILNSTTEEWRKFTCILNYMYRRKADPITSFTTPKTTPKGKCLKPKMSLHCWLENGIK